MRYPTSEKLEILHLVERSHLPIKQTLDKLASETLIHDHATRVACSGASQPAMQDTNHGHDGHTE